MEKTGKIEVYTDGSSLGNPGKGGYGAVIIENGKVTHELGSCEATTTNNRMEMMAVIEALKYLSHRSDLWGESLSNSEVIIHADSAYVLGGVTTWVFNWEKNGWIKADKKPVLNKDLWVELIALVRSCKVKLSWAKVKGHSGHEYNDRADEIATSCSSLQQTHTI